MGCSGGELRPQQHALLVTNMLDYRMGLAEAVNYPRFLWRGGTDLIVESGYQDIPDLTYRTKRFEVSGRTGVAQGVRVINGSREGVCDVRGEGVPLGI
jgi:gamma-glutamyltranspeptidase/glutathione hydrolase